MNNLREQIKSIITIVEDICNDIEKNNSFQLVPELMNLLEGILPHVFTENNKFLCFKNEEIIEVLNDIVDGYENKDSVLIIDSLRYGLNSYLNKLVEGL